MSNSAQGLDLAIPATPAIVTTSLGSGQEETAVAAMVPEDFAQTPNLYQRHAPTFIEQRARRTLRTLRSGTVCATEGMSKSIALTIVDEDVVSKPQVGRRTQQEQEIFEAAVVQRFANKLRERVHEAMQCS